MCFSKPPPPPAPPPPDASLEAQKYASFKDTSDRLAKEKEAAISDQRGKVYGLFGSRSLLGQPAATGGMRSLLDG
jgi:hypothetical protein